MSKYYVMHLKLMLLYGNYTLMKHLFEKEERERESKFYLPLPFCSTWVFNGLGEAYLAWGGRIFFTESASTKAHLFWKYMHRHPEVTSYLRSGHP